MIFLLSIILLVQLSFEQPLEIEWNDIIEIWEFAGSINTKKLAVESNNLLEYSNIKFMFENIQQELKRLKQNKD